MSSRPVNFIRRFKVSGGFLDGIDIELAPGLCCIIGGRGTGKTSVIELIRFALDRYPNDSDSRVPFAETLLGPGGYVELEIITSQGVPYTLRRRSDGALEVRDAAQQLVPQSVLSASLFDANIFSQNQIEETAQDEELRLELLDTFVGLPLTQLRRDEASVIQNLQRNLLSVQAAESKFATFEDQLVELPDVKRRRQAVEEAYKVHLDNADALRGAEHQLERARNDRNEVRQMIDALARAAEELTQPSAPQVSEVVVNTLDRLATKDDRQLVPGLAASVKGIRGRLETLRQLEQRIGEEVAAVLKELESARALCSNALGDSTTTVTQLEAGVAKQSEEAARLSSQLDDLRQREQGMEDLKVAQQATTDAKKELQQERTELLSQLNSIREERYELRRETAERITSELAPTIRVEVDQFGNVASYRRTLLECLRGSSLHYTRIIDRIVGQVPPQELAEIVRARDATRLMDAIAIDEDRANKMLLHLQDSELLHSIEVVDLTDTPRILLREGSRYKQSNQLSTGQRCTTILPILLLPADRPLIIDQPEDNLDNAYVYETVVETIRSSKERRQLIFVTHNPNIPVLGDADLVIIMSSDGHRGRVDQSGPMSDEKTVQQIPRVMEGGEEAFKLRKERYGY